MPDDSPAPSSRTGGPPWAVPDAVWNPIAVGGMLGAVGLIGLAFGQPWLFPSLGPTAYLQAEGPGKRESGFAATVVGHLVGLAAGIAAVWVLGANDAPGVMTTGDLTAVRVGAAALSGAATMLGLALVRVSHPPAAATTLLVALGGIPPSWRGAGVVVVGALITAALGEGLRALRRRVFVAPS